MAAVVYGHAAKLAVPLLQPAAPSSVLSVPGSFWTWTARDGDGAVALAVSAFAGSAPALSELSVESGPARYLERLAELRPDLCLDGERALLTTWPEGAYSTRERSSFDPAAGAAGGRRSPSPASTPRTIWFATMEGALRSGRRAASELLAGSS